MIEIKPNLNFTVNCPICKIILQNKKIIWQGPHVCSDALCDNCKRKFLCDLPVGQALLLGGILDTSNQKFYGEQVAPNWFNKSLERIITSPINQEISFKVEKKNEANEIIILNVLDTHYGHCLVRLLCLEDLIKQYPEKKFIIITPVFLTWMIPNHPNIAEIWIVKMKMTDFNDYYPDLNLKIQNELERFKKIELAQVLNPKTPADISWFTGIETYNFQQEKPRITFIWREDLNRLWIKNWFFYEVLKKLGIQKWFLRFHFNRVVAFIKKLKAELNNNSNRPSLITDKPINQSPINQLPTTDFRFTVAGLGKSFKFPDFIEDWRVEQFDDAGEIKTCKIYAESVVSIGIHGSSLILPSAFSGMLVCIMPSYRWGNISEDILFKTNNARTESFDRRIVSIQMSLKELAFMCADMIVWRSYFQKKFLK